MLAAPPPTESALPITVAARPRNQHVRLPFPLPSKRHPPPAFLVGYGQRIKPQVLKEGLS
jgi:hypothetical protein